MLGDGNFAVVRECVEHSTGREYALKIINKGKCRGKVSGSSGQLVTHRPHFPRSHKLCPHSVSQEHMIQNEVAILRRVKHPNIVLLIEEVDTYSELYLVMELVKVCFVFLCSGVSKLIQDSHISHLGKLQNHGGFACSK